MGTPRKQRPTFKRPNHPWRMDRITEEKDLCRKYGLPNKKEVWKAKSTLAGFRQQARKLLDLTGEEADKERKELVNKLKSWGIKVTNIDDVLGLTVENILERRLQSVVYRKGYANTPKQARQFIVHKHVYVGAHKVGVPSYIVLDKEEDQVRVSDFIKVDQSAKTD